MKKLSIVAFCGLIVTGFAVAADWPQFRGPDRTGISQGNGPAANNGLKRGRRWPGK